MYTTIDAVLRYTVYSTVGLDKNSALYFFISRVAVAASLLYCKAAT